MGFMIRPDWIFDLGVQHFYNEAAWCELLTGDEDVCMLNHEVQRLYQRDTHSDASSIS
jgi:hypothetical protein